MASANLGWVEEIPKRLGRIERDSDRKLQEIAERVGNRFLDDLKEAQPIGQSDELVLRGLVNRPARPSVRLGLVPIQEGWIGPSVSAPKVGQRVVTINTQSEHLKFFTLWTGRTHLGTKKGKPQVARNGRSLAFWWNGQAHLVKSAHGGGFVPKSDFVQDAWMKTKPYLEDQIDGFATYLIKTAKGEIVE